MAPPPLVDAASDESARAAALARLAALSARDPANSRPSSASSTSSSVAAVTAVAATAGTALDAAGSSRTNREAAMAAYSQFRASTTTAATASAASSFSSDRFASAGAPLPSASSLSSSSASFGASGGTGLYVNTSLPARTASTIDTPTPAAAEDPLTPRSRLALESTLSKLGASSSSQFAALDLDSSASSGVTKRFSSGAGMDHLLGAHPLSPHKELMNMLDSANFKGGAGTKFVRSASMGAAATGSLASGASSFASRSLASSSATGAASSSSAAAAAVSGVSTQATLSRTRAGVGGAASGTSASEDPKERSRCGTEIQYNALVRLRLNNHQCLRISALALSPPPPASSTTPVKSRRPPPKHVASQIDVTGDGLAGDDDQVFVLLNANMRTDCGNVHYSDVVALYCVGGSRRGHFLSVDPMTQQLTTKKGPVISNGEKWRLVNPAAPPSASATSSSGDLDDNDSVGSARSRSRGAESSSAFFSLHSSNVLLEQQKAIATSDKVLLKMYAAELLLSAQRVDYLNPLAAPTVVLAPPHDSTATGVGAGRPHDCAQVWELTKSNIPYDPSWNRERAYLTGEALAQPHKKRREALDDRDVNLPPLSAYPPSVQETIVIDDLLYAFVGVAGRYITLDVREQHDDDNTARTFAFRLEQHGMDPSVASLAARCFGLGESYLKLSLYVEQFSRYEYGQVNHAFCAALKALLKEYTIVIAQLEHQMKSGGLAGAGSTGNDTSSPGAGLSLQKLWFYIQPSLRTMEMLSLLVDACRSTLGGGALLSEIQRMQSSLAGDVKANQVFAFLLERASVPYLKMVERWIYHGDLVDPYDEFMIRRDDDVRKEDVSENPYSTYWQDRYTLRASQVPRFLARSAQKILTAGKYLNVFRTCRRQVDCPFAGAIDFAPRDGVYDELIDRAHAFASEALLTFFVSDYDLANRLVSLKHYFLMDQGDFFVDFMDVAEHELKLRADKLSLSRLESLLHLSLQTSTCSSDPYKDDLVCFLSPNNLISQMEAIHERAQKGIRDSLTTFQATSMNHPGYKVIDAFTLDYKVQWPLALVVSCGALTKYQMLFRHLFFCKHVERRLCDAWRNHQTTKELSLRAALGPSFCLRQRMLHFQQNFVYYMTFEVISPRWHAFERQLAGVASVDDILTCHGEFLDMCLKECLLTDPELLRVLTKLMTVCMTFANSIECFTRPYFLDEETIKAEREAERDRRAEKKARDEAEAALASFQRMSGAASSGISGVGAGGAGKKKKGVLKRRQSSQVDMRRARIKELSDDVKRALTEREGELENPFVRMTSDLENQFDSLLGEFMQQLLRRSLLQHNSHLSNLCTRLDYNGFYTK